MPGNLTSIESVIPTIKGNLSVQINVSDTTSYSMSVTSPDGTTGRIGVPKLNNNPIVTVGSTIVFQDGVPKDSVNGLTYLSSDSNYVYFSASPGDRTFTIAQGSDLSSKPDEVILLSPEKNSTDIQLRPTLTWQSVDSVENYELVLSEGPDFSDPLLNPVNLTETSFQVTEDLDYGQTYYWQVRGINTQGKSPWKEYWSFTTKLPQEISLDPNWPNPFSTTNSGTTIRYWLPADSHVRLDVYDISGRRVAVLVKKIIPAGEHNVFFDGNGLAGGVYFYRLIANGEVITRKMLMLK